MADKQPIVDQHASSLAAHTPECINQSEQSSSQRDHDDQPHHGQQKLTDKQANNSHGHIQASTTQQSEKSDKPSFLQTKSIFVGLGILSILGCLIAGTIIWANHFSAIKEQKYHTQVIETATKWTNILINLNTYNAQEGMDTLRAMTTGSLHDDFDTAIQPFTKIIYNMDTRSIGRVESAVIDSIDTNSSSKTTVTADVPHLPQKEPVVVIATSITNMPGGKQQIIHWILHLDIVQKDGHFMVYQLWPIR